MVSGFVFLTVLASRGLGLHSIVLLAGQYRSIAAEKPPPEVVVVNYVRDDNVTVTPLGYHVTESAYAAADGGGTTDEQMPPFHKLAGFVGADQIREWRNEWILKRIRGDTASSIRKWADQLFDQYGRKVIDTQPCTQRRGLFRADVLATPYVGVTSPCDICSK